MIDDARFLELWTDYLEGELDEAGLAELRGLLAEDERRLTLAADTYQTHRLLGLLAAEGRDDFPRQVLARLPLASDDFTRRVMKRLNVRQGTVHPSRVFRRGAVAAAAVLLVVGAWWFVVGSRSSVRPPHTITRSEQGAWLASAAGTRFFGELSPPVGSLLALRRDYVLTTGMVEVAFPSGATAIIEGPAVFRVNSNVSLGLEVGHCSVHAPDGAEGFRVETPITRVVDQGTRFTVRVSETSETEVQVIEGMADVSGLAEPNRAAPAPGWEVQLTETEARRFSGPDADDVSPARFTPSSYRRGLPDRVVSYEATSAPDGGADDLLGVTVQRDGLIHRYPVDRLIPVELTWFRSTADRDPHGHLAGGDTLPARRADLLSDRALNTGTINPGGSPSPLETDPVLTDAEGQGTPGMAVRFRSPVVNGPGPDVVFFELQTALNPPDGDAFHVSPLEFRPGRRSLTVSAYDLTMTSPEALKLAGFYPYRFPTPVVGLADLESADCLRTARLARFQALAVGIDLSDLGFHDGERVEGLFFQDAEDNDSRVDPVFIAGLPER